MGEQVYRSELDSIRKIIASVSRRMGFFQESAEDFASFVHEKLIQDDYALLGKFKRRSSLNTFLTVVVTRLGLDYRNHKWGKWRPSEAARREGELALTLERLLYRDGFTLGEASRIIRTNMRMAVSEAQIDELAARLPPRQPRVFVGEEKLGSKTADADAERDLLRRESEAEIEQIELCLKSALSGLDLEDRLAIRMHFEQGMTWTQIADALGVPRKSLYRRKDNVFARLRSELTEQGIQGPQVSRLLGERA